MTDFCFWWVIMKMYKTWSSRIVENLILRLMPPIVYDLHKISMLHGLLNIRRFLTENRWTWRQWNANFSIFFTDFAEICS